MFSIMSLFSDYIAYFTLRLWSFLLLVYWFDIQTKFRTKSLCNNKCVSFELEKNNMHFQVMLSRIVNLKPLHNKYFFIIFSRFSKENRASRHQYTFLPYGQGPRMCPGQKLAQITLKVFVMSLLRHYRLSTYSETEVSTHC